MADGDNLIIGSDADPLWTQNNRSDARTQLVRDGTVTRNALLITNLNGPGMRAIGSSSNAGVRGSSTTGAGVLGDATTGIGVQGGAAVPGASTGSVGVQGNTSYGAGVEGNATAGAGVFGQSSTGLGVEGDSLTGDGVWGISTRGTGVYGESIYGSGVEGYAPLKPGVRGASQDGAGVLGDSDRGPGVYGFGRSNAGVEGMSPGGPGVRGGSNTSDGVFGTSGTGPGVRGNSLRGNGGEGVSFDANGLVGITQRVRKKDEGQFATAAGVRGISVLDQFGVQGMSLGAKVFRVGGAIGMVGAGVLADGFSGTALLARVTGGPKGTGLAGAFMGEVVVDGNFTVFTGAKSAAVPHPDGSYRRMYTTESPESYFEDFGRARLVRGKATVKLEPDFAALIRRGDYYVFLTPEGPGSALHVSRRTGTGFEVRADDERATSGFCYRVVAKRKDIEGRRLERVRRPDFGRPAPMESLRPKVSKASAPPKISSKPTPIATLEALELAHLPKKRPRRRPGVVNRTTRRRRQR